MIAPRPLGPQGRALQAGIASMTRIDAISEMLANGMTVAAAAKRLGITRAQANSTVQQIRRKLGAQAV